MGSFPDVIPFHSLNLMPMGMLHKGSTMSLGLNTRPSLSRYFHYWLISHGNVMAGETLSIYRLRAPRFQRLPFFRYSKDAGYPLSLPLSYVKV